jgi:hypothetical protein
MMLACDASGGRFIIGRDRLSFSTGLELTFVHGKNMYDIPGKPAYILEFEDLHLEELDLSVAEQKAIQEGLDSKRWFDGIMAKKAYLLRLQQGQRFIYIVDVLDCWRSFLFIDPASDATLVQ